MSSPVGAVLVAGALRTRVSALPASVWLVLGLWVPFALLDSISTIVMMNAGFTEANNAALAGMDVVGVVPYCVLAWVVSMGLVAAACCASSGLYGRTVYYTMVGLGVVKMWVALNNVVIAAGFAPLPPFT